MRTETIRNRTQLTADDGMWLCNETNRVIAHKVILGSKSNETIWHEITEEDKIRFEALWNEEIPIEEATEASNYEKIIDILTGDEEG